MRDPQRQNRRGSSFKVVYPDLPAITLPPRSITLIQEMGKHDILEIYYARFSSALETAIKSGVPVEITWKNDKVSGKFLGYAISVSHPTTQKLERGVTIRCVGSSYPLKERASKIWINKTASEIAIEIANKFKLSPKVTPSPVRFTQQSLSGHSYWEKLNELANRIGYGVQVIGGELHFHPIDKMINQFMTTIPIMMFKDPMKSPSSQYSAPTLDYFEPEIGDYNESLNYSRTENTVGGVDPVTGKPHLSKTSSNKVGKNIRKATKAPLFSSIETHTVVASNAMARSLSEARAQMGRLAIPAMGIGQGDPRIAPWATIEVRGTGNVSDGFWIVKKVEHFIHVDGRYQAEFTVLSDGVGQNKPNVFRPSNAGGVPVRNVKNELATAKKKKPTSTKLSGATAMLTQASGGFKVTPRKWKAK
jgi:phage protein D